jgi:glycosyltransferase involved in cell wall biosynthesis
MKMTKVSIIIPTKNRLSQLKRCLKSLSKQKTHHSYEIIVVDDGSGDGTQEYLKHAHSSRIQCIKNIKGGPASARNLGAKAAHGKILAFLDDDCTANDDWVETIVESFAKYPDASFIAGDVLFCYEGILSNITKHSMRQPARLEVSRVDQKVPWCPFSTDNCAFLKSAFADLHGFDENFKLASGEDTDLCIRALGAGMVFYKINSMRVNHHQKGGLWGMMRRQYFFAQTDAQNQKRHFPKYVWLNFGYEIHAFFKAGVCITIRNDIFKTILILAVLSIFFPLISAAILLFIVLRRYFFETKNIKTTFAYYIRDIALGAALLTGGVVGSFKNKVLCI